MSKKSIMIIDVPVDYETDSDVPQRYKDDHAWREKVGGKNPYTPREIWEFDKRAAKNARVRRAEEQRAEQAAREAAPRRRQVPSHTIKGAQLKHYQDMDRRAAEKAESGSPLGVLFAAVIVVVVCAAVYGLFMWLAPIFLV